jgi:hypothetical protein
VANQLITLASGRRSHRSGPGHDSQRMDNSSLVSPGPTVCRSVLGAADLGRHAQVIRCRSANGSRSSTRLCSGPRRSSDSLRAANCDHKKCPSLTTVAAVSDGHAAVGRHGRPGRGTSQSEVTREYGVSRRGVITLVQRYLAEGQAGLEPRSRRPLTSPQRTAQELEDSPGESPDLPGRFRLARRYGRHVIDKATSVTHPGRDAAPGACRGLA